MAEWLCEVLLILSTLVQTQLVPEIYYLLLSFSPSSFGVRHTIPVSSFGASYWWPKGRTHSSSNVSSSVPSHFYLPLPEGGYAPSALTYELWLSGVRQPALLLLRCVRPTDRSRLGYSYRSKPQLARKRYAIKISNQGFWTQGAAFSLSNEEKK